MSATRLASYPHLLYVDPRGVFRMRTSAVLANAEDLLDVEHCLVFSPDGAVFMEFFDDHSWRVISNVPLPIDAA